MRMHEKIKIYIAPVLYLSAIILYLWARAEIVSAVVEPKIYPDSELYLEISRRPVRSQDFWASEYPVVVPVVYELLGGDPQNISIFQTLFSIFAWIFLASTIAIQMRNSSIGFFSFCIILAFSLSAEILLWDWVLLSESLSGSLFALFVASWIWFSKLSSWNWKYAAVVMAIGLLWMFTRDVNGSIVLIISGFLGILAGLRKLELRYLIFLGFFGFFFILSTLSINLSGRWIGPNLNLLSTRVLSNPEHVAFFQKNGMPVNTTLLNLAGKRSRRADLGFNDDPELDAFHEWHRENGQLVYIKFILSDPINTILAPMENISELIYTEPLFHYAPEGFSTILRDPLDDILFFKSWNPLTLWVTIGVISLGVILSIVRWDRKWAVPIFMCLLIYAFAFITWNASSGGDSSRHAYQFRLHYHVSIWITLLVSIDVILSEILPRYISYFHRFRFLFIGLGSVVVFVSLFADLVFMTNEDFSIGYVQGFGILLGMGLLGIGIRWIPDTTVDRQG
jgi:hypothetical protein